MGGVTERAIGMIRLPVRVRMGNLDDPAKGNEDATEETKRHP